MQPKVHVILAKNTIEIAYALTKSGKNRQWTGNTTRLQVLLEHAGCEAKRISNVAVHRDLWKML